MLLISGCATLPPRPPAAVVPPAGVYHTVEKGQTLWRIARGYGIDVRSLMAANAITDASKVGIGTRLLIPPAPAPAAPALPAVGYGAEAAVGNPRGGIAWRTITVHHSATRYGNAKVFDSYHRKRRMGGLFYHFLIGNGNGLGDGQIETGWRWKQQVEVNRPRDIQICLVGNFSKQRMSERQYRSLVQLIKVLRRRYRMRGPGCLRRHCDITAAARATECPGRSFPYVRLLQDISNGE